MTTKFTSILTYYLFLGTLLARPVLIGFYSLVMILFVSCRSDKSSENSKREDSESEADSDIGKHVGGKDAINESTFSTNSINKVYAAADKGSHEMSAEKLTNFTN